MDALDDPGPAVWCGPALDDDVTADAPPLPPLLPLLSLTEAQDVVAVLAAVVNGGQPDVETARYVLQNLAARVPSRG